MGRDDGVDDGVDDGWLDVGDGQTLHFWTTGAPGGVPVVFVHGGPGSGCDPGWARFGDPARMRMIGLDQRGCGRSTPDAADPATDLSVNTTQHLIRDLERLREHLGVERWIMLGASWGTTLALAYAQAHPDRVRGLVLISVVTTTSREVEWITRDMRRVFPQEWAAFSAAAGDPPGDLAAAYSDLLESADPEVRAAAARAWCAWEDTHVSLADPEPSPRYADPVFRYRFARLVTHYWRHRAFLPDGELLGNVGRLRGLKAVLLQGKLDVSGPPDIAWELAANWPEASFVVVDGAGHGGWWHPGARHRSSRGDDAGGQRVSTGYVHGYSDVEARRLGDQADTLAQLLHIDTVFPPGDRVLEVGCGVGAQTAHLLTNSPAVRLTCVDRSPDSLDQARARIGARFPDADVEWHVADLFALPFADASFDHLFVCFVLEHLADPAGALHALARVLRPGGTITVIEGDHATAIMHPDSVHARAAIDCLVTLQRDAGGNALIGRQLQPLLDEAGYSDVVVRPRTVYADQTRPDLVEGFTRSTFTAMVAGAEHGAIAAGLIDRPGWDRGLADLGRTAETGGTFSYTFFKARAFLGAAPFSEQRP